MKRILILLGSVVAFVLITQDAGADDPPKVGESGGWSGNLGYQGYQPWWDIFAKRNKIQSAEEERLQRFWHDYYDSLRKYYAQLDRIDWAQYYKSRCFQINDAKAGCANCGAARIPFAPVFVSPSMQWGAPNGPKVPVLGDLPKAGGESFLPAGQKESVDKLPTPVTPGKAGALPGATPPKLAPGQEARSPDDFELFLEKVLDAPRYVPVVRNGSAACTNGCLDGKCAKPASVKKVESNQTPASSK